MSILAGRLAATEGAYFRRETKQAVNRLVQNNPDIISASSHVVENGGQAADVLPEVLRHSLPTQIREAPPCDSSIFTTNKWMIRNDPNRVYAHSSLPSDARNPLRAYVSLPQVTMGPKRLRNGESSLTKNFPWLPEPPKAIRIINTASEHVTRELSSTIASKIIGTTIYNNRFVRDAAISIWECKSHVFMRQYNKAIFSFVFTDVSEKMKVLAGGPWYVGKDLFVVKDVVDDVPIIHTEFIWSKIWIRVYDLPPKGYTVSTATSVGAAFGGMVDYDLPNSESSGGSTSTMNQFLLKNFIRAQVLFDLRKPLYQLIPLEVELTDGSIVSQVARVAYEALPECCFLCGIVGHSFKLCKHFNGSWDVDDLPYSESLRATRVVPNNPRGHNFIPRGPRFNNKKSSGYHRKSPPSKMSSLSPEKKKQRFSPDNLNLSLSPPNENKMPKSPEPSIKAPNNCTSNVVPKPTPFATVPTHSGNMMPQAIDSGHFNVLHQPHATPMHYGGFFPMQSPFSGSPAPYFNSFQPNQYLQYGLFPPSPWSSGLPPSNNNPNCLPPSNQQTPASNKECEVTSNQTVPIIQADTTTLGNIAIGKTSYFAALSDDSPSPNTKIKTKPKKLMGNVEEIKTRNVTTSKIRTRSSGKGKNIMVGKAFFVATLIVLVVGLRDLDW